MTKNPHAVAMGKLTSPRKATASRANGRLGGAVRQWWLVLAGEGTHSEWRAVHTTHRGIACYLARANKGPDNWAIGYRMTGREGTHAMLTEYRGTAQKMLPRHLIASLGVPWDAIP